MNPYLEPEATRCLGEFLARYYDDDRRRTLILGINPGRFGAGITGITFTDPVALADVCGIPNLFARKRELSAVFIHQVIASYGGMEAFTKRFLLTAVSPLGFLADGKNLNYYDQPRLQRAVEPFIRSSIEKQLAMGGRRDAAIVLGAGKNFAYLQRLNDECGYFERLLPVEHPRFIMQYRRRRLDEYVASYLSALETGAGPD
jgi:hypothetical protein